MDAIQPVAAVIFVISLLGGALLLLKKRGAAAFLMPGLSGPGGRRLQLLERISLGPQHALHLVRVDGRTMVVTTAPGGCHILDPTAAGEGRP
ncbi:MAG: flagellar biosynthetic protein FliO [Acidobacteriota bacterium]|nr:flagellar biosynthetic protein FliO [Acidobacteriota bacterium]